MDPRTYLFLQELGLKKPAFYEEVAYSLPDRPYEESDAVKVSEAMMALRGRYSKWGIPSIDVPSVWKAQDKVQKAYGLLDSKEIQYLTPFGKDYPKAMSQMTKDTGARRGTFYPGVLFMKGDTGLLSRKPQIILASNLPWGKEVPEAIALLWSAIREGGVTPLIPICCNMSWTIVKEAIGEGLRPIVALDKGFDRYDLTEGCPARSVVEAGGLVLSNWPVGDTKTLSNLTVHRLYFIMALATRMRIIQVSPMDCSRWLMESAVHHALRVVILEQRRMPNGYDLYYDTLPPSVHRLPLKEWLML